MHKPSPSRMNIIASIAASLGMVSGFDSTAEVLTRQRGPAPKGKKYVSGCFWPAGRWSNVAPTRIKNPKVAANVQMMHEKWLAARNDRKKVQA